MGVITTSDPDAALAVPAECICYTAGRSWMQDHEATVRDLATILRSGKNVVNATWPALIDPTAIKDEIHDELETACLDGGSSLYTAGLDPGWGTLGLGMVALTLSSEVRAVRMLELLNYSYWDDMRVVDVYGFGQFDKRQCKVLQPGQLRRVWGSTVVSMADALGVELDNIEEIHTLCRATSPFEVRGLPIAQGAIAGLRYGLRGSRNGETKVVLEHITKLRNEDFPDEPFERHCYRAEVIGDPTVTLDLALSSDGGPSEAAYTAIAMTMVNAIPLVCEAAPGLLRFGSLPLRPAAPSSGVTANEAGLNP
jgi:4-hydroxy-tetrahydrodipicolinate reductase